MTNTRLELRDLHVHFKVADRRTRSFRNRTTMLRAVDGIDLVVARGESLGVVGESGCGKTTLARAVTGLLRPTSGQVVFDGVTLGGERDRAMRRRVQMVFQDPGSSLNPRLKVGSVLGELLRVHDVVPGSEVRARCEHLMDLVGLPADVLDATPGRLSGGQRQRIAIARALAVEPEVLIADEAVSALDVSVQAAVLELLIDLRDRLDLTLVFITHDLAVVRNVCDRIAVMYLGRIVETAPTETLFADPRHPYTQALLAAAPRLHDSGLAAEPALTGEPPSPLNIPPGCRFNTRCPRAVEVCQSMDPALERRGDQQVACHLAWS